MTKLHSGVAVVLVAAGLAAPAAAVAQDDPATYRCRQAAWAAGYSTAKFHLVVGTDQDDGFLASRLVSSARDIVCGFDGNDSIEDLRGGDVFLGGPGDDHVAVLRDAAFVGGPGVDAVADQVARSTPSRTYAAGPFFGGQGADLIGLLASGTFHAGDGADDVHTLAPGDEAACCARYVGGNGNDRLEAGYSGGPSAPAPVFEGGPGNDHVTVGQGAAFQGGSGADRIEEMGLGTMLGGSGDDRIDSMFGLSDFYGGTGSDTVGTMQGDPTQYGPQVFFHGEEDDDRVGVLRGGARFTGGTGFDVVDALEGGEFFQD